MMTREKRRILRDVGKEQNPEIREDLIFDLLNEGCKDEKTSHQTGDVDDCVVIIVASLVSIDLCYVATSTFVRWSSLGAISCHVCRWFCIRADYIVDDNENERSET